MSDGTERVEWARWCRLLVAMLVVFLSAAAVTVALSVLLIVDDESDHTDDWDGIGTLFGLILGGFALLVVTVSGMLLVVTVRARRRALRGGDTVRLQWAAGAVTVAGGVWLVLCLVGLPVMTAGPGLSTLLAIPGVPLVAASVGVLRATGPPGAP